MRFTAVLVDETGVPIQHSAIPVLAAVQGPKFVAPVTRDLQNGSFSISFALVATGAYTVRTEVLNGQGTPLYNSTTWVPLLPGPGAPAPTMLSGLCCSQGLRVQDWA